MSSSSPPPPQQQQEQEQETSAVVGLAHQGPVTVQEGAPRKFPAPCWTQDETLALISSYQDKWYSLRRRNLRTADWEAVALEVTRRCPNQTPAKTSAQCRHKMEKLRKRYRTEKQRMSVKPHNGNTRFFGSSWVFFDLMDAMELGSTSAPASVTPNNGISSSDLEVKPFSMNMNMNMNMNNSNSGKKGGGDLGKYFDEILLSMGGAANNNNNKGKSSSHIINNNNEYDVRSAPPHIKLKVKNHHHPAANNDDYEEEEDVDDYSGGVGRRGLMPPPSGYNNNNNKRRYMEQGGGSDKMMMMMMMNGSSGSRRKERGRESWSSSSSVVVGEMVASIKMLGEGLVKMEKMKMDMMRDIEKMRMEMEMKRSEMILESQHLIVNAFVEGLNKSNNKVKLMEID